MARLRWTSLLLCAMLAMHARASADSETAENALFDWIRKAGGEVNVEMGVVNGVRGTLAARDIQEKEYLAVIPHKLVWPIPRTGDIAPGVPAHNMLLQMANSSSDLAPYWASLPKKETSFGMYSFPPEYVEMLQSYGQEEWIQDQQQGLMAYWEEQQQNITAAGLTLRELQHAADMISTRAFASDKGDHTELVPLLDLANHENLCPNRHPLRPCPHNKSEDCYVWISGKNYKKGEEVCNGYGGMYADRAFIHYGYLLDSPRPPALFGVDRHDYDPNNVLGNNMFVSVTPAPFLAGTVEEYKEEASRLRSMLYYLTKADMAAASTKPAASDPGGRILELLLQYRELRKEALATEIERLKQLVVGLGGPYKEEEDYTADLLAEDAEQEEMIARQEAEDKEFSYLDDDDDEEGEEEEEAPSSGSSSGGREEL